MSDLTPKRKWMGPALLLSLAINLLIVGIVAGWTFADKGRKPDQVSREVATLVGPQVFRALEPDDRRALVRDVARQRDRARENRAELRARIERLLTLVRAEDFDTEGVRSVLEEQRASVARRHQFGEQLLLDRLGEMSVAERRAFADRLAQSLRNVRRD